MNNQVMIKKVWGLQLIIPTVTCQMSSVKRAYCDFRKSSYHDDEEVEHTHPAQLALNQGHQILEDDGDIQVKYQSVKGSMKSFTNNTSCTCFLT